MNFRSAFLLTILISTIAACTKIKSTDVGADLIPPVDNINTFDASLDVSTRNYLDTAAVYPLRTDNLVLGRISNDPLFGKTTGIINVQLTPEYFKYRFRGDYDSLKLDSMVLVLSYKGIWGDSSNTAAASQKLNVYEIDAAAGDTLIYDSTYSTRRHFNTKPTILGSATIDARNMYGPDTLKAYGETINKNQIRIKLTDPSIQNRLFKDTTILETFQAYRLKFAGFSIVPDTTSGSPNSLFVVNLSDTNTKVAFYYSGRISGTTKRDTVAAYFRLSTLAGYSNQVIRNQTTSTAEFVKTLDIAADSLVYLQTRPDAPYTRIKIPGLDTMHNYIIHRAELLVEQARVNPSPTPSPDDYFTVPALFLSAFSSDSSRRFMLPSSDVQFSISGVSNLGDFGAFPNRRYVNNEYVTFYSFNLTRYVQGIVTNKNRNYDLILWAPFADYVHAVENFSTIIPISGSSILNPLAIGRIRVGGGTHSKHRMRLRVIYTRI